MSSDTNELIPELVENLIKINLEEPVLENRKGSENEITKLEKINKNLNKKSKASATGETLLNSSLFISNATQVIGFNLFSFCINFSDFECFEKSLPVIFFGKLRIIREE
jgi:hypothetical protein